jgi:hypothetical protein
MSGQREWWAQAACQAVDPELFFPVVEEGPLCAGQVAAAKAVCAGCPVRAECLEWARGALPYGIAGGLTAQERRPSDGNGRRRRAAVRLPVSGSRREVAAAGRGAIRAGVPVGEVAREFGVTERTAGRWAAQVRDEGRACLTSGVIGKTAAPAGEGSRGGSWASLRVSHNNALAGTRDAEGRRGVEEVPR